MNFRIFSLVFVFSFVLCLETASALEYVRFKDKQGKERSEEGRIVEEGQIVLESSDSFAFEARDGRRYIIDRENVITRRSDDIPFVPYLKAEMIERLKEEFPPREGYNYLDMYGSFIVVYTTSRPFANWYGRLLEKLHEQYSLHWKRLGVELSKPEFPMVVIVFSNEGHFRQYAKLDNVSLSKDMCAYYHKLTNRIAVYDMSGQQPRQEGNPRRATSVDIQRLLTQPNSYNNIMTVIHEAVHQVGFNTGMHSRFAPTIPRWLCEGLAVFHEVPDTRNNIGWTLGPHVNRYRLTQLKRYLDRPHRESPFKKMIKDDDLFYSADTALDYYALAWGLTFYLVKKRPKELVEYLAIMQNKTPESEDSDEIRIKDFESCFGDDWAKFHKEFFDFLRKL